MKALHVILSVFLALLGYFAVVIFLMYLGEWYHGGYTYYDGPVGVGLGICGALVGLLISWFGGGLTKRGN
jgi:hypothetical protein